MLFKRYSHLVLFHPAEHSVLIDVSLSQIFEDESQQVNVGAVSEVAPVLFHYGWQDNLSIFNNNLCVEHLCHVVLQAVVEAFLIGTVDGIDMLNERGRVETNEVDPCVLHILQNAETVIAGAQRAQVRVGCLLVVAQQAVLDLLEREVELADAIVELFT